MDLRFIKHDEYLEVIYTGDRSFNVISGVLDVIYKECQQNNFRKILMDVSGVRGNWKEFDRFQAGEQLSQMFKFHFKVLAVEEKEKINKFAENTAVNRGTHFLVTHNKESGLRWLLNDE